MASSAASSLATHVTASLILLPLGIRRLLCCTSLYLADPSLYTSKIWYFSQPNSKNTDLYTLLIVLPLASFSHIFIFLASLSGSTNPTYTFSFLQHSFVIFLFWALLLLIILKESFHLYSFPDNFVFIFAAIAFLIEFYMSGRGFVGLGGALYGILGGLSIACAACCIILSVRPSAFFAEFLLSSGLVLKGTWVLQVGLSLYTDAFGLKGCAKISGLASPKGELDVKCELEDDRSRGVALLNLLFVWHIIVVFMANFMLFGLSNRNRNKRSGGEASGPLLAQIGGSGDISMHPLTEFELE
ncbi:hypothetical protein BUALT_Bualt12G0146600 [Buddleja alternifolia]|uniref:Uncharacterized protein n=1 Tax=Buddleja alternifolia TaxID=168488 RepID=A0AAV6WSP2_9LAMI|nr:hypothetical protein BUALT_Bualt12G0146600 [Buddleja alternifolia]